MSETIELERGVTKSTIRASDRRELKDGDVVDVLYTGLLPDGTIFDSTDFRGGKPLQMVVGAWTNVDGWNIALKSMREGEKAKFVIPASCTYAEQERPDIPSNSELTFEIEVVSSKSSDEANAVDEYLPDVPLESLRRYLVDAETLKKHGNSKLQIGDVKGAIYKYRHALQFIELIDRRNNENKTEKQSNEEVTKTRQLEISLQANLAQAYFQNGDLENSITCCDSVLKVDSKHLKALFRKARALAGLSRKAEALELLINILSHDEANEDALRLKSELEGRDIFSVDANNALSASTHSPSSTPPASTSSATRSNNDVAPPTSRPSSSSTSTSKHKSAPLAAAMKQALKEGLYPDKPDISGNSNNSWGSWMRSAAVSVLDAVANACPCGGRTLRSLQTKLTKKEE